jgi:hypothetical protein
MRWTIQRSLKDAKLPEVPKMAAPASIGNLEFKERLSLLDALPKASGQGRGSDASGAGAGNGGDQGADHSRSPRADLSEKSPCLTMESLGQSTGFLLYRTEVEGPLEGELALGHVLG